jgi:hypothetical protein
MGRRGIFYLFKLFLPAFAAPRGKGGGSTPCYWTPNSPTYDKSHHKTDPMNSNIYIFLIIAREFGQFKSSVSIKVLCHKIFNSIRGSVTSGLRIWDTVSFIGSGIVFQSNQRCQIYTLPTFFSYSWIISQKWLTDEPSGLFCWLD